MESFKVICKNHADCWSYTNPTTKLVTVRKFFGLWKSKKLISERRPANGPGKDEICIVTNVVNEPNGTYYTLAGYASNGNYSSKNFIRLDEFTETQKEIAEKSVPVLN